MSRIHRKGARGSRLASARRSLSLALLLTLVIGLVLTLGLMAFDRRARHGQEREALAQQTARAGKLASELESQLHEAEQLLNTLASLAGPTQGQRDTEALLRRMLASAPERTVYGVGVWFEPGRFAPGVRYVGPYVHRNLDEPGGPPVLTYEWSTSVYDYTQQPWYRESRRLGGRIFISEPYVEVLEADLVYETLTRAFYDDQGRFRGVVSVDIILPQVGEMVRQANVSPMEETLYVASPGGALLAHPHEDQLLAWAREGGHPVRYVSELTLDDLRVWEHERGLDRGWRTTGVSVPSTGWQVFVSTEEDALFKDMHHQKWLVLALGVVLWMGLGAIGVAMARSARARTLAHTLAERQRREEERHRLLAQVRQRSAELQAIIDSMVDPVLVVDAEGKVVFANPASVALYGQSLCDRMDTAYSTHSPMSLDGRVLTVDALPLTRALRGERVRDADVVITLPRPNNRKVVLRLNAAPIRDESGRVVAAVSVARDITQAIELERLQSEFVKMAAHELKTPLAVTKSFAQLAERTVDLTPTMRRLLEGICRGTNRMDRVVRTLLDTTQLQLGQLHFEKGEVEVRALVEAAVASTASHHPRNPVHVRPGPPAWVLADRSRLEQVFTELLDNAARYSPVDRPIEVDLSLEADEVELSIHDEGIGIPAERQDQVFERFYRAHAGTPHDRGGMGLGLYLARGIVTHHGGQMSLESQEGEGTTVRIRLPRLPEQRTSPGVATYEGEWTSPSD